MKLLRKILSVCCIASIFALSMLQVSSSSANQITSNDDNNSLKDGIVLPISGKKEVVSTKNIVGQEVVVSIEPERDSKLRVSNGNYKISYTSIITNCSFRINIKSNKITKVWDGWYLVIGYSVRSTTLKKDSSKQATYYFEFGTPVWDFGGWNGWLRAKINTSNKLIVTVK